MKNKVKKLLELKILYENDERFVDEMKVVNKLLEYSFMSENQFSEKIVNKEISEHDINRIMEYRDSADMLSEQAYMKLARSGKLTKTAASKIRKAVHGPDPLEVKQLLKQGKKAEAEIASKAKPVLKSKHQYADGLERGVKNTAKKVGGRVSDRPQLLHTAVTKATANAQRLPEIEKAAKNAKYSKITDPLLSHTDGIRKKSKITIRYPKTKNLKPEDKLLNAHVGAHEADEAKALKKMKDRQSLVMRTTTSGHLNNDVLRREIERNNVNNLFYKDQGVKSLEKLRNKNGEYQRYKTSPKQLRVKHSEDKTTLSHTLKANLNNGRVNATGRGTKIDPNMGKIQAKVISKNGKKVANSPIHKVDPNVIELAPNLRAQIRRLDNKIISSTNAGMLESLIEVLKNLNKKLPVKLRGFFNRRYKNMLLKTINKNFHKPSDIKRLTSIVNKNF